MSYRFVDSFRAGPRLVLVILYSWLSGMQEHMLLHTRQSAIQNNNYQSWSCSKAVYKPVWHIPLLSVQWISSWWWTDELSETCRVSWQNKFVKLVHLVGSIIKTSSCILGNLRLLLRCKWHLRFFGDFMQCWIVVYYRRFGTTYRSRNVDREIAIIGWVKSHNSAISLYFKATVTELI